MTSDMDIKNKVTKFLEKETQKKIGNEDVDLIAGGVLDSFTMIKLIDFIEKELGVKLDMERLTTENFNSINTIITGIKELGNRN